MSSPACAGARHSGCKAAGLEWLYRLLQDPRRMARRYIVGNTRFTWLVLREAARRVARRRSIALDGQAA